MSVDTALRDYKTYISIDGVARVSSWPLELINQPRRSFSALPTPSTFGVSAPPSRIIAR
jgi:hypothetical protein